MFPRITGGTQGSIRFLAALAALLVLAGCASYQVTVPDSDPIQREGQESEYVQRDVNAYLWGFVLDPQVVGADCQGEGINDVVVDRNFGQDLASVLSLGLWMPADLRYRCKAPGTRPGGDIPVAPSE